MLHRTQLSFIQFGGGIAVGVQAQQTKKYSMLINLNNTLGGVSGQNSSTELPKMSHHKQRSSIELGNRIMVGQTGASIHRANASIGVRTTTSQVRSQLYNDITSQIWNVGGVVCDLIIAICMTYYVGFLHFSLLSLGIIRSLPLFMWQLLRQGDTTLKATKEILKKIIWLTIGTGSLTGT